MIQKKKKNWWDNLYGTAKTVGNWRQSLQNTREQMANRLSNQNKTTPQLSLEGQTDWGQRLNPQTNNQTNTPQQGTNDTSLASMFGGVLGPELAKSVVQQSSGAGMGAYNPGQPEEGSIPQPVVMPQSQNVNPYQQLLPQMQQPNEVIQQQVRGLMGAGKRQEAEELMNQYPQYFRGYRQWQLL